jgi:hypothetical protein
MRHCLVIRWVQFDALHYQAKCQDLFAVLAQSPVCGSKATACRHVEDWAWREGVVHRWVDFTYEECTPAQFAMAPACSVPLHDQP